MKFWLVYSLIIGVGGARSHWSLDGLDDRFNHLRRTAAPLLQRGAQIWLTKRFVAATKEVMSTLWTDPRLPWAVTMLAVAAALFLLGYFGWRREAAEDADSEAEQPEVRATIDGCAEIKIQAQLKRFLRHPGSSEEAQRLETLPLRHMKWRLT
jgi:hypothetical protein